MRLVDDDHVPWDTLERRFCGDSANPVVWYVGQRQADFLRQHRSTASQAEAQSGIPAAFMVAQAAHESGWGRREIRHADGSPSHNLFGIKAGPG